MRIVMLKDFTHSAAKAVFHKGLYYAVDVAMRRDLLNAGVAYSELYGPPLDAKIIARVHAAAKATEQVILRDNSRKARRKGK